MRVVSFLPAATETVAALGRLDALVGVTHECDYPPQVQALPRVTASAVDGDAAPGIVDAQIRALGAGGASFFTIDEPRVASLRPDVILTQALCDVCAVSEDDVRALAARLHPAPRVVTLRATSLDAVLEDIATVGAALGAEDEAEELVAGARARMRTVHLRLKAARAPRPRVAVIEWGDPIYAAGHWMPEMVRRAGGTDVLAAPGAHSEIVTAEAVRAADPEVIVFAPCGYGLPRAIAEGRRLLATPAWDWARDRRVWALDANGYATRPGPRLVGGIEALAHCLAPALFAPMDTVVASVGTDA